MDRRIVQAFILYVSIASANFFLYELVFQSVEYKAITASSEKDECFDLALWCLFILA